MAFKNLRAEIEEEFEAFQDAFDDRDVLRRLMGTGDGETGAERLAAAGVFVEVSKIRSATGTRGVTHYAEHLSVVLDRTVPAAVAALKAGVCSQTVHYRRKHGPPRKRGPKPKPKVPKAPYVPPRKWDTLTLAQRLDMLDPDLTNPEVIRRTGLSKAYVYLHRDPKTREVHGRERTERDRRGGHNKIHVTPEQEALIRDPSLTGEEVMALTGLSEHVVYSRRVGLRPRGRNKRAQKNEP